MSRFIAIFVGLFLLVLLLLFTTTYTVSFHEVAVKTHLGRAGEEPVVRDPGLHFKLPFFIDQVETFDTRMQLVESPLETVPVADGQQILVRAFLLWRVDTNGNGPLDFYKAYGAIAKANGALQDHLSNAMAAFGRYNFSELLGDGNRLDEVEAAMLASVAASTGAGGAPTGISPERVGISKIVLPPATTRSVIERMTVTRRTIASNERNKGSAEAQTIASDANTKAEKIRAFADSVAAEIRGEGSDVRAKYLSQMAEDQEFAVFLAWKNAFERSLSSVTTFVLPPNFAPLHLIDLNSELRTTSGIPVPNLEVLEQFAGLQSRVSELSGGVDTDAIVDIFDLDPALVAADDEIQTRIGRIVDEIRALQLESIDDR